LWNRDSSYFSSSKGLKVTGIDISPTAINYAKEKTAKNNNLKINFIVADVTDLSFLKNKKFDLILDWANLHGIPKNKQTKYIQEISSHSKKGAKLILRCFGRKKQTDKNFIKTPIDIITLFTIKDIENLYSKYFKIIDNNTSKPPNFKTAPSKFFYEFLMKKL